MNYPDRTDEITESRRQFLVASGALVSAGIVSTSAGAVATRAPSSDMKSNSGKHAMSTITTQEIVPIGAAALMSTKLVKHVTLKIYKGAPHGLAHTHKEQLNRDLLEFLKA